VVGPFFNDEFDVQQPLAKRARQAIDDTADFFLDFPVIQRPQVSRKCFLASSF